MKKKIDVFSFTAKDGFGENAKELASISIRDTYINRPEVLAKAFHRLIQELHIKDIPYSDIKTIFGEKNQIEIDE